MSIIHTFIPKSDTARLSRTDGDYLRGKLKDKCMLSSLLNKKVNRPLLTELRCVLDKKPVPRRKTKRYSRVSKIRVYNTDGVLLRILHANGKLMKQL